MHWASDSKWYGLCVLCCLGLSFQHLWHTTAKPKRTECIQSGNWFPILELTATEKMQNIYAQTFFLYYWRFGEFRETEQANPPPEWFHKCPQELGLRQARPGSMNSIQSNVGQRNPTGWVSRTTSQSLHKQQVGTRSIAWPHQYGVRVS